MDALATHRKQRLRSLIERAYAGSQSAFAVAANLSEGRVSQLLADSTPFGERSARRIEQELRLSDRFFEENFQSSLDTAADNDFDENVRVVSAGKRAYPVISYIQAGELTKINDPYSPGDGFDLEYGDDIWSKWTFALELEGESMLPEFRAGDRVLIDPTLAPNPGDYVAAKNSVEKATFKRYRLRGIDEKGAEVFELVPLNVDFPTLRSDIEPLVVIGVMVEHRKRYRTTVSRRTVPRGRKD